MRRKDEAEFVEFAHGVVAQLQRTAFLMCGDWHRAEDAAQDALVRVYTAWPRLKHRGGLRSYAHKALVSVVLDQAKRPWRREHAEDELPDGRHARDGARTVDDRLLVVQALAGLPPRQRACVVLRHYVDLSLEETAQTLGIGVGAVKSNTSRGLASLRAAMRLPDQNELPEPKERVRR